MKKITVFFCVIFVFAFLFQLDAQAVDSIIPGEFITDPATIHCLGFRWYVDGDDNGNATVQVIYKKSGTDQWKQALNMLRVNREFVDRGDLPYTCDNLFAGSIMNLEPATIYDVNFVLFDPDGGQDSRLVTAQTISAPIVPSPTQILHVYPPGWSSPKNQPSYDTISAAFSAVSAGKQILLYPGVHTGNVTINKAGTATAPIVIKGAGQGEAIVRGVDTINNGKNFEITGSKYLYFENITVEGGLWGIYGGSKSPITGTKNLVVRNCRIIDVGTGINTWAAGSENWYLANNVLIGRDPQWYPRDENLYTGTGINIYGRGHIVCYNKVEKFWDSVAIADYGPPETNRSLKCVAIDMYGNDLSQAMDDCLETDFGCHNIRVWNNRLRDAHAGLSCQPVYGGPVYLFRNEMYGFTYTPYKLHNWPSGIYIFNNTSVLDYQGFTSEIIWQNSTVRNNLILGTQRYAMETGSPDSRTTLDYNGYRKTSDPIRFLHWYDWMGNDIRSATLADFFAATGFEQHGIMVDFNAFRNCPVPILGQTHELYHL